MHNGLTLFTWRVEIMSLLTVMLIVIRSESSLLKLSMLHANDRHGKAEQSCN